MRVFLLQDSWGQWGQRLISNCYLFSTSAMPCPQSQSMIPSGTIWSGNQILCHFFVFRDSFTQANLWQGPDSNSRNLDKLSKLRQKTWDNIKERNSPAGTGQMPLKLHEMEAKSSLQGGSKLTPGSISLRDEVVGAFIFWSKHLSSTPRWSCGAGRSQLPGELFWRILNGSCPLGENSETVQCKWIWPSDTNPCPGRRQLCKLRLQLRYSIFRSILGTPPNEP